MILLAFTSFITGILSITTTITSNYTPPVQPTPDPSTIRNPPYVQTGLYFIYLGLLTIVEPSNPMKMLEYTRKVTHIFSLAFANDASAIVSI